MIQQFQIETILKAGRAILDIYNSTDFGVEIKSDDSPLTLADKAAHKVIMEGLAATDYPVLSEEGAKISYEQRKKWKKFWLVDPLDGTKEFIKKNGEFTVNIALVEKGVPVYGFVYAPVFSTLYFGGPGKGAYKRIYKEDGSYDEKKISTKKPKYILKVVASRSHLNDETKTYIKNAGRSFKNVEFIQKGSSLKLVEVAEGKAHLYPRLAPTMEWDTAAAHAIVLGSGGSVNRTDGSPLAYNKKNLLNPKFIVKA